MVSKALLPIGNVPVINLVLDWVLESGLRGMVPSPGSKKVKVRKEKLISI